MSIHDLFFSLVSFFNIVSLVKSWAAKKLSPWATALSRGSCPLSVGDVVSMRNNRNYLILKRKGKRFNYEYLLMDVVGGNPWLLPLLASNSASVPRNAAMFWAAGSSGGCYLKKIGHPKLEIKIPSLAQLAITGAYPAS